MDRTEIEAALAQRPYQPVELILDNGEKVRLPSPEVLVGRYSLATYDRNGLLVLVSLEAVSLMREIGDGKGSQEEMRD